MSGPLAQLYSEHRSLAAVLHAMSALVREVRERGKHIDPKVFRAILYYLDVFPEREHHWKEEAVLFPRIRERWFSMPNILLLWPVPAITALTALMAWRWLDQGRDVRPFFAVIFLFLLGYGGLAVSVFPYLVPYSLTIWDSAAVPASQMFMLIGTLPLLPIILIYTGFIYYLFRGKLKEREGYH